jgi:hypothetical protein
MLIVLLVTGDAGARRSDFLPHGLAVTVVAIEPLVASVQPESAAGVVVEIPDLPIA